MLLIIFIFLFKAIYNTLKKKKIIKKVAFLIKNLKFLQKYKKFN